MPANLATLLQTQANLRPGHTALLDPTKPPITFAALQSAVEQGCTLLHKASLHSGDRVLVYQPISAELYVALGAAFYAGLTVVFIDPGMRGDQLERAATTLAPRAFLATPRAHLLRLLSPAIRRIPIKFTTGEWPLPGARRWLDYRDFSTTSAPPMIECRDDTPALVTVTSGSTGTPKFATRTHGFLRRQHQAIHDSLQMAAESVVMTTLPIFILSFLASGVTTLLPTIDLRRPGKVQVAPLLAQMQQAAVNALAATPALLDQITRFCAAQQKTLPQIRQVYTGGAPVFVDLLDQAATIMPNATLHAVYGATEAEPIAILDHAAISTTDRRRMAEGAGLLAGKPVSSLDVRIIPDRWGEPHGPYSLQEWVALSLPAATSKPKTSEIPKNGEIVVSGAHVLTSVGPSEEATLTKIDVGKQRWHRTGDAGSWDEENRLWLLGRCAARIDRRLAGGSEQTLYPFQVESAAHTFPAVKHAALVEQGGRCILALELYTAQDEHWFASFTETLAWAALDEIRILARLPVDKRHNAKIDYPALRRLLGEQ
jgi:acyl-CoA synthetase (AMP-forming)/AMP-acid ligase II